jgi:hypothetical protein
MRPQMRWLIAISTFVAVVCLITSEGQGQPGGKKEFKGGKGSNETVDEFVAKLMAFNKAKNGKLTKEELFDTRLHALFDRADTKKQGFLTKTELEGLFARERLEGSGFGGDFKGKGGPPKKKGGPDGDGNKGPSPEKQNPENR